MTFVPVMKISLKPTFEYEIVSGGNVNVQWFVSWLRFSVRFAPVIHRRVGFVSHHRHQCSASLRAQNVCCKAARQVPAEIKPSLAAAYASAINAAAIPGCLLDSGGEQHNTKNTFAWIEPDSN